MCEIQLIHKIEKKIKSRQMKNDLRRLSLRAFYIDLKTKKSTTDSLHVETGDVESATRKWGLLEIRQDTGEPGDDSSAFA